MRCYYALLAPTVDFMGDDGYMTHYLQHWWKVWWYQQGVPIREFDEVWEELLDKKEEL